MLLSDFVIEKTTSCAEFASGKPRKKRKDAGMKKGSRLGKIAGAVGGGIKKAGSGIAAVAKSKTLRGIAGGAGRIAGTSAGLAAGNAVVSGVMGKALGMSNKDAAYLAGRGARIGAVAGAARGAFDEVSRRKKKTES